MASYPRYGEQFPEGYRIPGQRRVSSGYADLVSPKPTAQSSLMATDGFGPTSIFGPWVASPAFSDVSQTQTGTYVNDIPQTQADIIAAPASSIASWAPPPAQTQFTDMLTPLVDFASPVSSYGLCSQPSNGQQLASNLSTANTHEPQEVHKPQEVDDAPLRMLAEAAVHETEHRANDKAAASRVAVEEFRMGLRPHRSRFVM